MGDSRIDKQVSGIVRKILTRELKECRALLKERTVSPHTKDFVNGFTAGIKKVLKSKMLTNSRLDDMYGRLKIKEGNEYRKRRAKPQELRRLKGELHAVISVRDMVIDAMNMSRKLEMQNQMNEGTLCI